MRAALDDLAATAGEGRRVAVLGDMLELGPEEARFHAEIGAHAADARRRAARRGRPAQPRRCADAFGDGETQRRRRRGAGGRARRRSSSRAGDTVLVKASRGVGLERVTEALAAAGGGRA